MENIPHLAESFGLALQMFRERSGLTQIELAKKIGSVSSYIRFLEHGKKIPTLTTFHHLCHALDVDLHEFMDTYQNILNQKTNN